MNRITVHSLFAWLIIMTCSVGVSAQTLQAYYVVGDISYTLAGRTTPVVMATKLPADALVVVPEGGKVELLDAENQKRLIITGPASGIPYQLAQGSGGNVMNITPQYVGYVENQLNNKLLTSQSRHTDFSVTAQRLDSLSRTTARPCSMADQFNDFRRQTRNDFDDFRRRNNEAYAEFVRQAWQQMDAQPPVPYPQEQEVEPVVYDDTLGSNKIQILQSVKKAVSNVVRYTKRELDVLRNKLQPKPATPPSNMPGIQTETAADIPIKEVEIPQPMVKYSDMPFTFYGMNLSVRIDETKRLNIGQITPTNVADILKKQLSTKYYDNTIIDCLRLRKELHLCDWAYLEMLKTICDQFCGTGSNEAALLLGYLYQQSGYNVRYASTDNHLYLLVATPHIIYNRNSYLLDDLYYFPVEEVPGSLYICRASFPQEQTLSLYIPYAQKFQDNIGGEREIVSKRYPDFKIKVAIDQTLMQFYSNYPSSFIDPNPMSRWAMYANTPMNEEVKQQIYPTLHQQLDSLDELNKVEHLLNLVQTGFEYQYDDSIWGGDRAFFAEETLNYPFCDCEDRAILFTRLVRDVVGLKCALVYYPGHLAAAVKFNVETGGSHYPLDNDDYTLCDPTYIGAEVGREMTSFIDTPATLIPLE